MDNHLNAHAAVRKLNIRGQGCPLAVHGHPAVPNSPTWARRRACCAAAGNE